MVRFKVTISILDEKARVGHFRFYVDLFTPLPDALVQLEGFIQGAATRLDGVIGGVITGMTATMIVPRPAGLKAVATSWSDVEERIRVFWTFQGRRIYKNEFPTFNHALIPPGATEFDPNQVFADAGNDLINWLTGISSASFDGAAGNQYGDPLDYAEHGLRIFRKTRR